MAIVKLISGQVVYATLTDIKSVGEEGSRTAIARIDGKTYEVYNSIVDGFDPVWHEQMDYETWKMLGNPKGFVEGSTDG